jgi:hypothetical protein
VKNTLESFELDYGYWAADYYYPLSFTPDWNIFARFTRLAVLEIDALILFGAASSQQTPNYHVESLRLDFYAPLDEN